MKRRSSLERAITGAIRSTQNDHGPITRDVNGSAVKRVVGQVETWLHNHEPLAAKIAQAEKVAADHEGREVESFRKEEHKLTHEFQQALTSHVELGYISSATCSTMHKLRDLYVNLIFRILDRLGTVLGLLREHVAVQHEHERQLLEAGGEAQLKFEQEQARREEAMHRARVAEGTIGIMGSTIETVLSHDTGLCEICAEQLSKVIDLDTNPGADLLACKAAQDELLAEILQVARSSITEGGTTSLQTLREIIALLDPEGQDDGT